jgi:hypothetical protein
VTRWGLGNVADIVELGKRVRAKYPGQYDDLSDIELGRRVKAKFPQEYADFADVAAPPQAQPGFGERMWNEVTQHVAPGVWDSLKAATTSNLMIPGVEHPPAIPLKQGGGVDWAAARNMPTPDPVADVKGILNLWQTDPGRAAGQLLPFGVAGGLYSASDSLRSPVTVGDSPLPPLSELLQRLTPDGARTIHPSLKEAAAYAGLRNLLGLRFQSPFEPGPVTRTPIWAQAGTEGTATTVPEFTSIPAQLPSGRVPGTGVPKPGAPPAATPAAPEGDFAAQVRQQLGLEQAPQAPPAVEGAHPAAAEPWARNLLDTVVQGRLRNAGLLADYWLKSRIPMSEIVKAEATSELTSQNKYAANSPIGQHGKAAGVARFSPDTYRAAIEELRRRLAAAARGASGSW